MENPDIPTFIVEDSNTVKELKLRIENLEIQFVDILNQFTELNLECRDNFKKLLEMQSEILKKLEN